MRSPVVLALGLLLFAPTLARSFDAVDDKIDPSVQQAMARGNVAVILLGSKQLLSDGKAFDAFCNENKDAKRSALRPQIIARLKEIAAEQQPAILEALDAPDKAGSLWLVNAVVASLSQEQIKKAAALDAVKYVYPAGNIPTVGDAGELTEVIKPAKRETFTTLDKRIPWNVQMINACRVWDELNITGEGTVVAMYDEGVNYRHEDLRGNLWINEKELPDNGKDDDDNGLVDDYYGYDFVRMKSEVMATGSQQHGTWTAGIVAGDGSGGLVTGVAPRSKLMLIRAFGGAYLAALAHQYAVEHGADVMNMSFSQPNLGHTRGLWRLMSEHATCAGLVLVSGAGNFQRTARIPVQLRIPEGIPCVIAAGGVDMDMKLPPFVSLGPVEWGDVKFYADFPMPQGLIKPDVCGFPGPGYPVLATADKGYIDPNNRIAGNSFSGPHVVGVAALMLSAAPDLPAWRVKEILEATATDVGDKGKDNKTGAGLLNAYKAVSKAMGK